MCHMSKIKSDLSGTNCCHFSNSLRKLKFELYPIILEIMMQNHFTSIADIILEPQESMVSFHSRKPPGITDSEFSSYIKKSQIHAKFDEYSVVYNTIPFLPKVIWTHPSHLAKGFHIHQSSHSSLSHA